MKQPDILYPILREFKADGDTATLKSLKMWVNDYHIEPPRVAANDNNPDTKPLEWEARIDAVKAEDMILSMAEDENCVRNPDYKRTTRPYSAALHEERFERVKHTGKEHMPAEDINAEDEVIRYVDAVKMRDWLGSDADVLDMAVEPQTTFADIGQHICADEMEAKQEVVEVASTFYDRAA